MNKILLVEDDRKLAELLCSYIEKYGFQCKIVTDFEKIIETFNEYQPDLVLLDVNLPHFDGFYWCRQMRTQSTCSILFLSAREGEMDQVMALENGADDYIVKPFHYQVVIAKIRSHLRRVYGDYAPKVEERIIELEGVTLFPERMELKRKDEIVYLSKKEASLLEVLFTSYPRVVNREILLEKLWDDQTYVDDNTLNVNVTRVRKRLSDLGIENAVETVRGVGYSLSLSWKDEVADV